MLFLALWTNVCFFLGAWATWRVYNILLEMSRPEERRNRRNFLIGLACMSILAVSCWSGMAKGIFTLARIVG